MAIIANDGGHATADQALDEAVHRVVEALNPVAIYHFGSRARGTARPDSDFDPMAVTRSEDGEAGYDYTRAYAPQGGDVAGNLRSPLRRQQAHGAGLGAGPPRPYRPTLLVVVSNVATDG